MFLVDITNISHTYRVNELAFSITKVVNITNKTKKVATNISLPLNKNL
jgi:hypothetical protein